MFHFNDDPPEVTGSTINILKACACNNTY